MARAGQKTKLTPDRQKKILDALRDGNYFEVACQYAGIDIRTGMEWLQRGRGDHPTRPCTPLYAQFAQAVTHAQAEDEVQTLARLKKAGQGGELIEETIYLDERTGKQRIVRRYSLPDTQSDQWRMERKHTQRWGRKERIDVHHTIETLVKELDTLEGLTVEERTALVADIEAYAYGRS